MEDSAEIKKRLVISVGIGYLILGAVFLYNFRLTGYAVAENVSGTAVNVIGAFFLIVGFFILLFNIEHKKKFK